MNGIFSVPSFMPGFFHSTVLVRFMLTHSGGSVTFSGVEFSIVRQQSNPFIHVDGHLSGSTFGLLQMELVCVFWSVSSGLCLSVGKSTYRLQERARSGITGF